MRAFIYVFMLSLGAVAYGQDKVPLKGIVSDSLGAPIELANVVATDKETGQVASFGYTDHEGRFLLKLEYDKTYQLTVSFVGYQSFKQEIIVQYGREEKPFDIVLKPSTKYLDAVEIVREFPITISGDTISYKAEAFTNGNERKLKDVLKDLPGFEVDENGEVSVQGKKVEKIMVEGKEFFEGDTKIASENIPGNAVDRVQVLRNFSDVAFMNDLDSEDRLALNIELKDDKKNMLFGDVEAGIGLDQRYVSHANLFFYHPKTTLNFIGDANNIGQQAFTPQDYFRFTGGLRGLGQRSGSNFQITSDNLGLGLLQDNTALEMDNRLGALNFNHTPSKKWKHSGFLVGSYSENNLYTIDQRTYVREQGDNQEVVTNSNRQENVSGIVKLETTYTPNESLHVSYNLLGKASLLENTEDRSSDFQGVENSIDMTSGQDPVSVKQQVEAFYALDEKNIFSLETSYSYQKQDPFLDLITTLPPFPAFFDLAQDNSHRLQQGKEVVSHQQESLVNYYRVLNRKNHFNVSLGNSYSHQQMTSFIHDENGLSLGQNNDIDFTLTDWFAGANYKMKLGPIVFNPGVNLHYYQLREIQAGVQETFDRWIVLPNLNVNYKFTSAQSIVVRYAMKTSFADVQNVAQGLIIQNYNNLFRGNRDLVNSIYHDLGFNYYNFSIFNALNLYGGVNYRRVYDDISDQVTFNGLDRTSTPVNIKEANETLTAYGNISKSFNTFRLKGNANVSYFSMANLVDEIDNRNRALAQDYQVAMETTFFKVWRVEAGFEKVYNRYNSNTISTSFITDRPFATTELSLFNSFTLTADYEYNHYRGRDGSVKTSYDFLNASLSYQGPNSAWQVQVSGANLLNTSSIRRDNFSENLVSAFEYFVQPRYFLCSIKYDL